jgi:hypothetical protein
MRSCLADIFAEQHDAKLVLLQRLRQPDLPHPAVLVDELLNIIAAHYAVLDEVVLPALPPEVDHLSMVMESQKTLVATVAELIAMRHLTVDHQAPVLDAVHAQIKHQRSIEEKHLLPAIRQHLSPAQEAICCIDSEMVIERRVGVPRP